MKDPGYNIRKAYYDKLQGITYAGSAIPFFSNYADVQTATPYIILTSLNTNLSDAKHGFETTALVTIEAVTRYPKIENVGATVSELIASEALNRLIPYPCPDFDLGPDFQNLDIKLSNSLLLTDVNDNDKIFRKILSFFHHINEK